MCLLEQWQVLCSLLAVILLPSDAAQDVPVGCFFYGWRFDPNQEDMAHKIRDVSNPIQCQNKCKESGRCLYFGFVPELHTCWLLDDTSTLKRDESVTSGPANCRLSAGATDPCSVLPGPGFPGATASASNEAWPTKLVPTNLQCWPRSAPEESERLAPCLDQPLIVLEDTASGWPGKCDGLSQVVPAADVTCKQACEQDATCPSWQEVRDFFGRTSCWQGVGTDCWDISHGVNVLGAQRFMRGHYRVLMSLTGYDVENLRPVFNAKMFRQNTPYAVMACNHSCLSLLFCEMWTYSLQEGCRINDPSYKEVSYPPTTAVFRHDTAAAQSVVAGEYIQRLCARPAHEASGTSGSSATTAWASNTVQATTAARTAVTTAFAGAQGPGPVPRRPSTRTGTTTSATFSTTFTLTTKPTTGTTTYSTIASMMYSTITTRTSAVTTTTKSRARAAPAWILPTLASLPWQLPAQSPATTWTTSTTSTATSTPAQVIPVPVPEDGGPVFGVVTLMPRAPGSEALDRDVSLGPTAALATPRPSTFSYVAANGKADRFIKGRSVPGIFFQDCETGTRHIVRGDCLLCGNPPPCANPVTVDDVYLSGLTPAADFECSMLSGGAVTEGLDFLGVKALTGPITTTSTTTTSLAPMIEYDGTKMVAPVEDDPLSGFTWLMWFAIITLPCFIGLVMICLLVSGRCKSKRGLFLAAGREGQHSTQRERIGSHEDTETKMLLVPIMQTPETAKDWQGPSSPHLSRQAEMHPVLGSPVGRVPSGTSQNFAAGPSVGPTPMGSSPHPWLGSPVTPQQHPHTMGNPSMGYGPWPSIRSPPPLPHSFHPQFSQGAMGHVPLMPPEGFDLLTVTPEGLEIRPLHDGPPPPGVPFLPL